MAGKGDGEGEGNVLKLTNQIEGLKYVLVFTNILEWVVGVCIFALCLWLRFEPGIQEWLQKLEATQFYNGIYVLFIAAIVHILVPFIGCIGTLQESTFLLLLYSATQIVGFVFGLAGAAVLLDNSAQNSRFQPVIRESMRRLIMNAHHIESRQTLALIQENIGCCGADGSSDYLSLRQPLPTECRDTVTGNPFFHGCVDELTWFFEEKCAWVAGLALTVCFIHVCNIVLSIILNQALRKEEDTYATK